MTSVPLSRRTILRGLGVTLGLPLLDAMLPATARGAEVQGPLRAVFMYKPGGMIMPDWTPKGEGKGFELSPTLEPLAKVKDQVLVLSGLDARNGETGGNGHPLCCSPWLSTAPINDKDRGGYCTDITVDQVIAQQVGDSTRLASLELGCAHSAAEIHTSNISWRAPASPMGKEVKPRAVFTRLFGDAKGDRYRRSILDSLQEDTKKLQGKLGAVDRHKVDEYFDAVRSVERRIQIAETKPLKREAPKLDLPEDVPANYVEHLRLMGDLLVLALEADCTRVVTFLTHNEDMIPSFPSLGVRETHHTLVHNGSRPGVPITSKDDQEKVDKLKIVDRFYVEELARLLERMRSIREGQGTLLDHTVLLYGSGLSWGNLHIRTDLPILLAGGGCGHISSGRHVKMPKGTPLANAHLSILKAFGVDKPRVADSTEPLKGLKV